jgi:hypothetical protein
MERFLLGKTKNVFDPQHRLRIPGVLNKGKSFSRDDKGGNLHLGQVITDLDAWKAID